MNQAEDCWKAEKYNEIEGLLCKHFGIPFLPAKCLEPVKQFVDGMAPAVTAFDRAPSCQRCALPLQLPWHHIIISTVASGERLKAHSLFVLCETCIATMESLKWWPARKDYL